MSFSSNDSCSTNLDFFLNNFTAQSNLQLKFKTMRNFSMFLHEAFSSKPLVNLSMTLSDSRKHYIFIIKYAILVLLIAIGFIGNFFNCIVFGKKSMRKASTFRFLFYLSASDLMVLLVGASHVLVRLLFNFDIRLYSTFTCKVHTFLTYFFTHISSLILMIVSLDRVIKMKNLKKTSKTRIVKLTKTKAESRITIGFSQMNTEGQTLDVRFEGIKASKKVSIRVKFHKNQYADRGFSFTNVKPLNKVISSIQIKQKPDRIELMRRIHNFFANFLTVDSVVLMLFLFLFISNFHFILFVKLFLQKVEIEKLFNMTGKEIVPSVIYNNEDTFKFFKTMGNDSVEYFRCAAVPGSNYEIFMKTTWYWAEVMSFSLFPFFTMCISSLIISIEFKKVNKNYLELIAQEEQVLNKNHYLRKIRKNRQICLMLFNSNFLFLFLNLQYWSCFFVFRLLQGENDLLDQLQSFSSIIIYTNNVYNFFIFGITSSKYRQELFSLFK